MRGASTLHVRVPNQSPKQRSESGASMSQRAREIKAPVPKLPLPPGVQRNRHKRVTGVIQNRTGPPAVAMHRRAVAHWRRQQRACAQTRSLRLPLARLPRAAPCRPFRPSPQARRSKRACLTSITPRACAGAARAAGATREAPARTFARNQHLGSLAHISAFGCRVWAPPSGSVWSEVDAQPPHATPQRRPPAAAQQSSCV